MYVNMVAKEKLDGIHVLFLTCDVGQLSDSESLINQQFSQYMLVSLSHTTVYYYTLDLYYV